MFQLKISTKVWVVVLFVLAFGLLTSFLGISSLANCRDTSAMRLGEQLQTGHELRLEALVQASAAMIGTAISDTPQDKQADEVQRLIEESWFKTTINEEKPKGYFFVYDMNGVCVAHASRPKTRGDNRLDYKDANGKTYIRDMISASKSGGGLGPV